MRWIVGLLLVAAAILKASQLIVEPAASHVNPFGAWFIPAQIGLEFLFGFLVLSGAYWRQVRWVALLFFAAFAVYSLVLAIRGEASCGCFGPVKVHPGWTFLLDGFVVLGLVISLRSSRTPFEPDSGWFTLATRRALLIVLVAMSGVCTAVLVRYADSRTAAAESLNTAAGELVVLEPDKWLGQPLPISNAIDIEVSEGKWIVLLHRYDCPDCQAAVSKYEELAIQDPKQQIALVEIPPYGEPLETSTGSCARGRLQDDREWFVQAPVEIQLIDGVVTSASMDLPALASLSEH